jgi:hypothetical protein
MNEWILTPAGVAHAELLLVTCLKQKILQGIKISSLQCVVYRALCRLQYLKTKTKSVLC